MNAASDQFIKIMKTRPSIDVWHAGFDPIIGDFGEAFATRFQSPAVALLIVIWPLLHVRDQQVTRTVSAFIGRHLQLD